MRHAGNVRHGRILDGLATGRLVRGLIMLAAFCAFANLVRNTVALREASHLKDAEIRVRQQKVAQLKQRHALLRQASSFYQSDAGVVAASRPLGYGLPGEQRVMFESARRSTPPRG
jgi:hypothetical protein